MPRPRSCAYCGVTVKVERYGNHLRSVHPDKATEGVLANADREAKYAKGDRPARKDVAGEFPWKPIVAVAIVGILVVGGGYYLMTSGITYTKDTPINQMCASEGPGSYHIHVQLSIVILGKAEPIPEGIGADAQCHRPIHTHEDTGKLHVESPIKRDFHLKEFFQLWGKPFSANRLLTYYTDDNHALTMTVDGTPSTQYGDLVFVDGQNILIEYKQK